MSIVLKIHKISKKLAPFIHLPIQSGSNTILKSMNRKHTREDYLNIIKKRRRSKFCLFFCNGSKKLSLAFKTLKNIEKTNIALIIILFLEFVW